MILIVLVLCTAFVYVVARVLVRVLGWPTDVTAAGRWGVALLVLGALLANSHGVVEELFVRTGAGSGVSVSLSELIPGLLLVGLAVAGYIGWTRGASTREAQVADEERTVHQQRRRVVPPPPVANVDPDAQAFTPLNRQRPGQNGRP